MARAARGVRVPARVAQARVAQGELIARRLAKCSVLRVRRRAGWGTFNAERRRGLSHCAERILDLDQLAGRAEGRE